MYVCLFECVQFIIAMTTVQYIYRFRHMFCGTYLFSYQFF